MENILLKKETVDFIKDAEIYTKFSDEHALRIFSAMSYQIDEDNENSFEWADRKIQKITDSIRDYSREHSVSIADAIDNYFFNEADYSVFARLFTTPSIINSFDICKVLRNKEGSLLIISFIYKIVAFRLGVKVDFLNSDGIARRYRSDGEYDLIDFIYKSKIDLDDLGKFNLTKEKVEKLRVSTTKELIKNVLFDLSKVSMTCSNKNIVSLLEILTFFFEDTNSRMAFSASLIILAEKFKDKTFLIKAKEVSEKIDLDAEDPLTSSIIKLTLKSLERKIENSSW